MNEDLRLHREAEFFMGLADQARAQSRPDEAAKFDRQAAELEAQVFALLPHDRPKTRGITAVSSVALFRKSGAIDEAIRHAHLFLYHGTMMEYSRQDLEEMLDEMRSESLANASGRTLGEGAFEWVLIGPGIGPGKAPLPVIARKIDQISKYGVRVFEHESGLPVRISGPPEPRVINSFDMVMGQPYAGSFRFQVRLSTPSKQLSMFDEDELLDPIHLGRAFGDILEAASSEEPGALAEAVKDERYRDVFLRSLRAMAPDGKGLVEVQVVGHGKFESTFARLTPSLGKEITSRLSGKASQRPGDGTRLDVLRGVDLNEGWILLGKDRERRQKWYVRDDVVLADVVEDLLDRPVRVTGTYDRRRRRFYVDDLEAVEEDASPTDQSKLS